MKLDLVKIHNFRSIKDVTINPQNYSILLGANNAGKTNILTALRIFYEDSIKFESSNDFPKFKVDDEESWIEIAYKLTDAEFEPLKKDYKEESNGLRVRKYLKSTDKERVQAGQSNIYGYENGILSGNLFYGAKNISQAKLGNILYIPEVTQTTETLKMSGPSPLRDMINFVVKKVVDKSDSFQQLMSSFKDFNDKFRDEQNKEGLSLQAMIDNINKSLAEWKVRFGININSLEPEDLVKSLVTHFLVDERLNEEVSIKNTGQGMQRHLIFTLLRLSLTYADKKTSAKSEFSPELTLLLFEEPEAFLHPCQQECLNRTLKSLSADAAQQIIISTHSPIFVSKNIENMPMLIRLNKTEDGMSVVHQISEAKTKSIIEENVEIAQFLRSKIEDSRVSDSIKNKIRPRLENTNDEKRIEEESIRYSLWLDPTRCSAFFSETVLICEGATERVFIDYLIENKWDCLTDKRVFILDAMGKYNIHRYMNLFKELGIIHSVLLDTDDNKTSEFLLNEFIEDKKNEYTRKIAYLDKDIETFLGINPPQQNSTDKKPLNMMWHYHKGKISPDKVDELKRIIESLLT